MKKTTRTVTEAPAPVPGIVEAKRDYKNDLKPGDVVEISGATGATGKRLNGLYYVQHGYSTRPGEYWLRSVKTDRGSKYEGIGKKVIGWPVHCYSNNPDVCLRFREETKDIKIEGLGPVSGRIYSLMAAALSELESEETKKNAEYYGHSDNLLERAAKLRSELERMESERPGLKAFAEKMDARFSPKGPGLAIRHDGFEVRNKDGIWEKFNLIMTHREKGEVFISGSYYGRCRSSTIPRGFGFQIVNNSDGMTDYFEEDHCTVTPEHPLFAKLSEIIDAGRGRYELTDEDAGEIEAYLAALKAEEVAKRDAEQEARRAEDLERDRLDAEAVEAWTDAFPWAPGCGPSVVVEWSEAAALATGTEEESEKEGGMSTRYSVEAFDRITEDMDRRRAGDKYCGYDKIKFTVEFSDDLHSYTDRIDVGDGVGGLVGFVRSMIKYHEDRGEGGETATGLYGYDLDYMREVLRRLEAATDQDARAIDRELDSLAG